LAAHEAVWAIVQKLADANPKHLGNQHMLANNYSRIGRLHARQKQFAEAFAALDKGLTLSRTGPRTSSAPAQHQPAGS
jgi:hypothetical protein